MKSFVTMLRIVAIGLLFVMTVAAEDTVKPADKLTEDTDATKCRQCLSMDSKTEGTQAIFEPILTGLQFPSCNKETPEENCDKSCITVVHSGKYPLSGEDITIRHAYCGDEIEKCADSTEVTMKLKAFTLIDLKGCQVGAAGQVYSNGTQRVGVFSLVLTALGLLLTV